ncbi:NHL repeat containing protein, partial [mine drainage metagenome]
MDGAGNVYIADTFNDRVVEVTPSGTQTVLNVSVSGGGLNGPTGVAVDGAGDVYIADASNHRVVEVGRTQQSLTFANTAVGATSAAQTVTLANIGNQPLSIASLTNAT